MALRPTDPEERRRQARRWRERQREAARRYEQKVKEEVLDGEREWNSVPPVNQGRRREERERAYGPPERRAWVASLPCIACGSTPSENAHVETGGIGYKADADKVVPLCAGCHRLNDDSFHALGSAEAFGESRGLDLHAEAARIEAAWQRRNGNG